MNELSFKAALEALSAACSSACSNVPDRGAMHELLQAAIKVVALQPDRVPSQNAVLVKDNIMLRNNVATLAEENEKLHQDNVRLSKENITLRNMISDAQRAFKGFI